VTTGRFEVKEPSIVTPCPKCGNRTQFFCHSERVAEDNCNVWVVCVCGFDPTENDTGFRFETPYGGVDKENIQIALSCWDDALLDSKEAATRSM
jgi:hypothetical protein